MHATNFIKENIPQINKLLKFVLENPYSDFYKNKYKGLGIKEIKSYEDFQKIPLLTKDEILAVPLKKRTFVSSSEVRYYSFASGTTNHMIPTVIPHSSYGHEDITKYHFDEKKVMSLGVNRFMMLTPLISPLLVKYLALPKRSIVMIPADVSNLNSLKVSAKIAKELAIDAISGSPTRLYFFTEYLTELEFDLGRITWINLGGEFCSAQRLEYFKLKFPNAIINIGFGTSETNGMRGYRCDYLADKKPNIFHPTHRQFVEVANDKEKILHLGEVGELIHTDLITKAFPLIRYKTKDIGSLIKHECKCGNNFMINLGGRTSFDVLKFSGITLYAESVAQAISAAKDYIEPIFEIHVFEKKHENKLKPKLKLTLILKKEFGQSKNDAAFAKTLEERISQNLYLSGKTTLKQLVERDIFLPMEIVFLNAWPKDLSKKSKNIISHL